MIRFHGVLAPSAALRKQVVASARPWVPPDVNHVKPPMQLSLFGEQSNEDDASASKARRKPWAWLLRPMGWPRAERRPSTSKCREAREAHVTGVYADAAFTG
jgi:hypothetical protein